LPGGLAGLDGEAQAAEHPDGTRLPALLQARGRGPSGLRSNVMDVVGQMTEAHGMSCSVQLDDRLDQEVPGEIGEHLLYALREALSNAAGCQGLTTPWPDRQPGQRTWSRGP
jgi:hypothetical protein